MAKRKKPTLRRKAGETATAYRNRRAKAEGFKNYYEQRVAKSMRRGRTLQESRGHAAGPESKAKRKEAPVSKPRRRFETRPVQTKTKSKLKRTVYDFSGYRSAKRRRDDFVARVIPNLRRRGDDGQVFMIYQGNNIDSPGATFGLWQTGWIFGDEALLVFDRIETDFGGRVMTVYVASVPR